MRYYFSGLLLFLVVFACSTSVFSSGSATEFDRFYAEVQKPLGKPTITRKQINKTGFSNDYYMDKIILNMAKVGVEFKGLPEYIIESGVGDLMAIRIQTNRQRRITKIVSYYNFIGTRPGDEGYNRESFYGRFYALRSEFGNPKTSSFNFKKEKGYCVFDAKNKYILFGSYGETDLVIAEISKELFKANSDKKENRIILDREKVKLDRGWK